MTIQLLTLLLTAAMPLPNFAPGPEYADSGRMFQGIPTIERASNGRLWAAWYGGGVTEDKHNYLVLDTSGDDGRTWERVLVLDPDREGPLRAFDPCLWHDPQGRLWLFWAQRPDARPADCLAITTTDSGNRDATWSVPRRVFEGIMINKPTVVADGRWLMPTAIWGIEGSVRVLTSSDHGVTFTQIGAANVPKKEDRNCDEPMLVQRNDGTLWMLVRTRYGIGESVSSSGGRTWTDVVPTGLLHPASRFFLRRLASGRLLLVRHNPPEGVKGRSHLTAFVSEDDGRTWKGGLLLDERRNVSYPDGVQADNGLLYVIYDFERQRDKEILLAAFREADVLQGRLTSADGRLRVRVNQATGQKPVQQSSGRDGEPQRQKPAPRQNSGDGPADISAPAAAAETPSGPAPVADAMMWLQNEAHRLIRASRRTMQNGTAAFPPQVGRGYEAFWLRDYAYTLEGTIEAYSDQELLDACRLFVRSLRADGAGVDCVKFDGTSVYMPGYGRMGKNPVADGTQFTVAVVWHTYRRTKDAGLMRECIEPLLKTMKAVPRNPDTRLVHIQPGEPWDRCPYGFTDTIRKQGDLLFCSLLYVQASRQLADLLHTAGRAAEAEDWNREADRVAAAIRRVFWDPQAGLFRAATVCCREHDIWGSAFAVYLGVATEAQAQAIATVFRRDYSGLVQHGQIRHLPPGVYWEKGCAHDTYQNGGYWATPTGWFVYTLDRVDPALADRTVLDLVEDFRRGGVCEWIFQNVRRLPGYLASASLPLAGIRAMLERRPTTGGPLQPGSRAPTLPE